MTLENSIESTALHNDKFNGSTCPAPCPAPDSISDSLSPDITDLTLSAIKADICFSLASFPGSGYLDAYQKAQTQRFDPAIGELSLSHVQLCPQNCIQIMDESVIDQLKATAPDTEFRFHANVKVMERHIPDADLCDLDYYRAYFDRMIDLNKYLNPSGYSLHAGRRQINKKPVDITSAFYQKSWDRLIGHARKLEDLMGIPVGIEGHHPTPGNRYWIDSWAEYRKLFESNAHFALDLAHLHIVAVQSGIYDADLLVEMLKSPYCMEIHVSHNNGLNDQHTPIYKDNAPPWWAPILSRHIQESKILGVSIPPIFYEGNLKKY